MSYSIGQLAKATEMGVETIRFYERRGLMPEPPRTASGYRQYPRNAVDRLHFIQRAKRLGFTLDEIATLMRLEAGGDRAEVKEVALTKLEEIEARMADLERMRTTLRHLSSRCSGTGPVAGCPIIAALSDGTNDHE